MFIGLENPLSRVLDWFSGDLEAVEGHNVLIFEDILATV